jgi:fatty acid desaturase
MLVFILITSTLFMHVIADYNLQGILAMMKQRDWWKENAPEGLYKNDYLAALIAHAFMWSCLIILPALVICWNALPWWFYMVWLCTSVFAHSIVDDTKANRKCINLVSDQLLHVLNMALLLIVPVYVVAGGGSWLSQYL